MFLNTNIVTLITQLIRLSFRECSAENATIASMLAMVTC